MDKNIKESLELKSLNILCPDQTCTGFTDKEFQCFQCPFKAEIAILCTCGQVIKRPCNFQRFLRIDCKCTAAHFALDVPYRRINV